MAKTCRKCPVFCWNSEKNTLIDSIYDSLHSILLNVIINIYNLIFFFFTSVSKFTGCQIWLHAGGLVKFSQLSATWGNQIWPKPEISLVTLCKQFVNKCWLLLQGVVTVWQDSLTTRWTCMQITWWSMFVNLNNHSNQQKTLILVRSVGKVTQFPQIYGTTFYRIKEEVRTPVIYAGKVTFSVVTSNTT